ncbi:S-adenosyl-L-methionine-dependent methyltransferase [Mollisia scopiformis]|uniref:S-adenosyl-L-methionine-dependent methyltransferase n=1 Tax=Mollisia scopiformis TaxID=149040 RepID=A0A194X6R4_MOLSC|nr:S-adenosyl-L-methionine-dependent methyltransferase [Mollisia scopiformis]KUJ15870.1 S-adenosyl-L-methionine-dependent methyltransferase [Mollisia scopiformis]
MASKLLEILMHIIQPLYFLLVSASYIPTTIFHLLIAGDFNTLFSLSLFKDAWFANFWGRVGPEAREMCAPRAGPLIESAHGIVLDIGPGSGEWLKLFDKSKVTRILGVEPNRDHHAALKKRIQEAGLEGIYEIVPVGVEDLGSKWVGEGEVDTVVTIQCLCSVDEPRKMIDELYGYLKEGGIWVLYEHVVAFEHQGMMIKGYQSAIDIVWPHFIGGCSITRDTGKWMREAGNWSKVDLYQPDDEPSYNVLPHVMGTLTK